MKRTIIATTALACVLAVSGCSDGSTEQPGSPTSRPEAPTSPATSIVPPVPVPSTPPRTSTASPSPTAEASPSSVQAYCQTVQRYQREATEAITDLPKRPQSLRANLAKLQSAREQIQAAEPTAPDSLKKYVTDQVDALDDLVAQVRAGDVQSINPDEYTEAAREFVNQCDLVS